MALLASLPSVIFLLKIRVSGSPGPSPRSIGEFYQRKTSSPLTSRENQAYMYSAIAGVMDYRTL